MSQCVFYAFVSGSDHGPDAFNHRFECTADPSHLLSVVNQALETEIEVAVNPTWRELCGPLKSKAASLKALMGLIPELIMATITSSCNEIWNDIGCASNCSSAKGYPGLAMALDFSESLLSSARKATFVLLSNAPLGSHLPFSLVHKALVHLLLQCRPSGKAVCLEGCCCANQAFHFSNLRLVLSL